MSEVTTFPDVLDLVRVHLEGQVGVPAGDRLPPVWPVAGYLEVSRVGGSRTRLVEDVTLEVAAWHSRSAAAAERLAGEAASTVVALEGTSLDNWQVLDTGNPGGVVAEPDPRFPDMHRATVRTRLRVRGVTTKKEGHR